MSKRDEYRTWTPPQRGPKESAEYYCEVLQGRINAIDKLMKYESRDRKIVLQHRIEHCQRLMLETVRGKK